MANDKEINQAFGNDAENSESKEKPEDQTEEQKNEEVKESTDTKEDSKKDNSSIGSEIEGADAKGENKESKEKMYSQSQVDAMLARTRKKYSKGSKDEFSTDAQESEGVNEETEEANQEQRDLSTGITVDKLARAELKAQMAIDGVNPSKLVYACRMIDVADVTDESGNYSEEMAKTAIEELLKVMPELKATQQQEQNQFSFGAPEQQEQNPVLEEKNRISEIFGN
ncbi:hypothetical protein DWW76_12675 [Coprobacillus sp. AF17-11AC]|nr:hypothetical protein DWW80_11595 [Coprobacillus sp. AF17-17AC]RGG83489.1 hypothetical protein DWW76_12675 [Coprobacillus sp. AF17-11AC]